MLKWASNTNTLLDSERQDKSSQRSEIDKDTRESAVQYDIAGDTTNPKAIAVTQLKMIKLWKIFP